MRASVALLHKLVDFDWTVDELVDRFTTSGTEVESVEFPERWVEGIVVCEVLSVVRDSPRSGLSTCVVTDGERKYETITGAPDVAVGIKAPFAKPGATIFGGRKVGVLEIDGARSEGMLCSGVEVGLGLPKDRLLPIPGDAPLGADLRELLGWTGEAILELEITPNRPDCYGHWGLAREIAAMSGVVWEPAPQRPENVVDDDGGIKVELLTPSCPRYTGRLIEGVSVGPSPLWLQGRLAALGVRPINNIVDITNFVMMLTGQPIHAFDGDKLGRHIVVRQAREGEVLVTLDGVERELGGDVMVIATPQRAVALAGIMGGADTEVSEETRNVVVEVAYFDPVAVRRGRRLLGLSTESSVRFERGTDPNAPPVVSDVVAAMAQELAGAKRVYRTVDEVASPFEQPMFTLTDERVERLLGKRISREEVRRTLVCLGFEVVSENAGGTTYRVPSFRPDVDHVVDLVEEVGRIHGLNRIEPSFRAQGEVPAEMPQEVRLRRFVEDYLCGLGFRYALTDPLGRRELFERFAQPHGVKLVELTNPLSDELSVLRPNPLPTLIAAAARNLNRGARVVRLFEVDFGYGSTDAGYDERLYVALACGGARGEILWDARDAPTDLFDVKGAVEALLERLGARAKFLPTKLPYAEPKTALEVKIEGKTEGFLGELAHSLWDAYELKNPVFFALLSFEALLPYFTRTPKYEPFSRFPAVRRDVALIVDDGLLVQELLEAARELAPDAERVAIFDLYRGKPIPEGKKSVGLVFVFRSKERTLTDEEVNERFSEIVARLCERFGAEVRR